MQPVAPQPERGRPLLGRHGRAHASGGRLARETPLWGGCLGNAMGSQPEPPNADDGRSDETLMEAYCHGDATAFERLVGRHSRGLYNYLLRSVHTQARAEELLQEVLLRVIRSKDRYKRSAKFTTWVYTIARNLTVDESRRARFRDHESLDAPRRGHNHEMGRSLLGAIAAEQVATDDGADAPRLRERLAGAIDELPSDQREVFLMRQMAGLSFREIGEAVGAPENTVKSRMRYALEKLRQVLADLEPREAEAPVALRAKEGLVHG
jgi:RNA polymerase sigma-70 factor (ECF subfamily)